MKVRSKKEVIDEARNKGRKIHFASWMDLPHLKNPELEPRYQKNKGRVVLRGDIVKDDSGAYAVFTEQGSSASPMTAAKVMDIVSRLPGCVWIWTETWCLNESMSPDEVLLFFLMMMSGWLPLCHEGAADCRLDRFLLSVSSCTSSLAHLHAPSLLQPVSMKNRLHHESGEQVEEPISPEQYRIWHPSSCTSWWDKSEWNWKWDHKNFLSDFFVTVGFVYSRWRSTVTDGVDRYTSHLFFSCTLLIIRHVHTRRATQCVCVRASFPLHAIHDVCSIVRWLVVLVLSVSCFSPLFTSSLPHSTCTLRGTSSPMSTTPRDKTAACSHNEEYCPMAIYRPLTPQRRRTKTETPKKSRTPEIIKSRNPELPNSRNSGCHQKRTPTAPQPHELFEWLWRISRSWVES